jgi:hypothetical protein
VLTEAIAETETDLVWAAMFEAESRENYTGVLTLLEVPESEMTTSLGLDNRYTIVTPSVAHQFGNQLDEMFKRVEAVTLMSIEYRCYDRKYEVDKDE